MRHIRTIVVDFVVVGFAFNVLLDDDVFVGDFFGDDS